MNILPEIFKLLETEKLCFLATSHEDHPHVCLMNYTYLSNERQVILSSRANTTKVSHIEKNPSVAILIYSLGNASDPPVSCTFYGTAAIVEQNTDRERDYREAHYANHVDMGAFITGDNIIIIAVHIQQAALSDIEDSVQTWSFEDS